MLGKNMNYHFFKQFLWYHNLYVCELDLKPNFK